MDLGATVIIAGTRSLGLIGLSFKGTPLWLGRIDNKVLTGQVG